MNSGTFGPWETSRAAIFASESPDMANDFAQGADGDAPLILGQRGLGQLRQWRVALRVLTPEAGLRLRLLRLRLRLSAGPAALAGLL